MSKTVLFFSNGNTAVFIDEQQVPELQQSWLVKFVEFLEAEGHDPTTFQYTLSNGKSARVFRPCIRTDDESSWIWEIK